MLRVTVGLLVVGVIFYHSPVREPMSNPDATSTELAAAAENGLRGVLTDGRLDEALAGAALGRVFLDNARVPQRVISLSSPAQTGGANR